MQPSAGGWTTFFLRSACWVSWQPKQSSGAAFLTAKGLALSEPAAWHSAQSDPTAWTLGCRPPAAAAECGEWHWTQLAPETGRPPCAFFILASPASWQPPQSAFSSFTRSCFWGLACGMWQVPQSLAAGAWTLAPCSCAFL